MRLAGIALAAAFCLFAQASRDAYRDAYKLWRQADPNLERDAAVAGGPLEARAQKMAADATQYEAARKAFLHQMAQENNRKFAWLETAPPDPPPAMTAGTRAVVAEESSIVQRSMTSLAGDPDPGIQRLRGMLQRENVALTALNNAMADREKAARAAEAAARSLETVYSQALQAYRATAGGWTESVAQTDRESAEWVEYYKLLANGARQPAPPAPSSVETKVASAPATEAAPPAPEPIVPSKPSITAIPLIRYTGSWTYPASNGLYHGTHPETADLTVRDDNGRVSGTLVARFTLAPGVSGDAALRFSFSGDFANRRIQELKLQTSDGATGTLELIPGPAFNLLEINFQIDARPGKVRQGNMVLVKK